MVDVEKLDKQLSKYHPEKKLAENEPDKTLFKLISKLTYDFFNKKVKKYYAKKHSIDKKPFVDKLDRDYNTDYNSIDEIKKIKGRFPVHFIKAVIDLNKDDYDCVICILRGAIPFTFIFKVYGWKIKYVICRRPDRKTFVTQPSQQVYDDEFDKSIKKVKGKKVLLLDNNVMSGATPTRVVQELKTRYGIEKPDLIVDNGTVRKDLAKEFDKITIALDKKVSPNEEIELKEELLRKLKRML